MGERPHRGSAPTDQVNAEWFSEAGPSLGVLPRVLRIVQERGLGGAVSEVWSRFSHAVANERRILFFRVPVTDLRRVAPRLDEGMHFVTSVVSIEEGLRLAGQNVALTRMLQGHVAEARSGEALLVGRLNGRLASWCIVATGTRNRWPISETTSDLSLEPTDAVFTAGFVAPEYRGRRLFQAMYGAAADLAATQGARRLWSWCEHWNEASRGAMLAVGFQYLGSHARRNILGIAGKLRAHLDMNTGS